MFNNMEQIKTGKEKNSLLKLEPVFIGGILWMLRARLE
jgi:hypothetical protein